MQGIEQLPCGADVLEVAVWQQRPCNSGCQRMSCNLAHVTLEKGPLQIMCGHCRQHTQLRLDASEQGQRAVCMLVQYVGHFAALGGLLTTGTWPLWIAFCNHLTPLPAAWEGVPSVQQKRVSRHQARNPHRPTLCIPQMAAGIQVRACCCK